ncbi:hypothetical protein PBAL39_13382 [Pedobacter sp. BAL39]|nr:hypothetical protein PBAL39_13382 [Pedobacter sp. BAL39]
MYSIKNYKVKKINVNARIRRNMLAELSGSYFKDENSDFIIHLNSGGKDALVGIQREDGVYTVIGNEKIYYLTLSGIESEISINEFLDILSRETLSKGKSYKYEFIKVKANESIWIMNADTMNALWNTMLLFDTRI